MQRTGPAVAPWVRRLATAQPAVTTAAAEVAAAGPSGWTAATAGPAAGASLTDRYRQLVAAGTLQHDPAQEHCVHRLDRLSGELKVSCADGELPRHAPTARQPHVHTEPALFCAPGCCCFASHHYQPNDALQLYSKRVEEHQLEHAAYEAKRAALRPALMAAEEARLAAEEEAAAAAAASRLGGMKTWLSAALGAPPQQAPVQRTKHQRAVLARAAVERRLDEQLGPAPAPPSAPKGACRAVGGVQS